ncbi:PREDICTED: potassium voltage-gated channel subfamily H member 6-like [Nicrophorus vespilloides]|uniref:Potassium voltage-gated channel subfamily H member 6-like n=1 Tax=Nicrophorus vespilloides TaxID=110193 RepID=A0ABM1MIM6_NICVS|nr:PREDICTED: potassium voltage-gated channel subfamily H member 6-like [Nicrophorus vespilloides]
MTMMAFIVRIAANMGIANKLSSFYSNLSHLKKFLSEEKVTKELTKRTIDYFEFMWAKSKGTNCKLFKNVSDSIKQDLAVILYSKTLLKAPPFLNMGIGLIRRLGLNFNEVYVLDNVYMILRNDIVNKLYIVNKGIVALYTADGSFLELLGKGSMFGNIDEVEMSRSMVSVQARTNVVLLEIDTILFYKLLENDPECIARMNYHIIGKSLSHITSSTNCNIFKPTRSRINVFFETLIWMESSMAMELAFAMLSFVTITFYMMFKMNVYVKALITLFDVIFALKIYVNLRHINIVYKQQQRARRKKMTRFPIKSFLLDLLSILPFEALAYFFTGDLRTKLFTFLHINRLLRMFYIFRYFKEVEQFSNHMILEKLIAITSYIIFVIQGGACIFFLTAKLSETYLHKKSWLSSKNCNDPYICSLFYTITTITFHGHPYIVPHSPTDMIVCIVFSTGCKYIFATISGFILSFYAHIKLSLNLYNQLVEKLLTTLMRSNISKKLIHNVTKYTHQIWIQNNGQQMPKFLTLAPSCVTDYVMMEIYGKHLIMNPIFCNCHVDFLRQLSSKLQLTNYFASDVICHAGEVNSTMYFIQSGQVEVLDIEASDEIVIDILGKDDCFGIVQGLINCAKHVHTFRASHICKILSLEYKVWEFLLPFFPASKYTIYESLENITNTLQPNR